MSQSTPSYLGKYETIWQEDPLGANLQWFQDAKRGLFIHFSPASLCKGGHQEWIALDTVYQEIHNRFYDYDDRQYEYWLDTVFTDVAITPSIQAVWDRFSPDNFDADAIADCVVNAGMKYITFTTRHVMGRMFMFETDTSPCNSVVMRPHRDFVRELAVACQKKQLGFFLYVMPPFDDGKGRVQQMLTELLTRYGPIAGIWFDGIGRYYQRPDRFDDLSRTYEHVRSLQPGCLVSFKTGATGEEDFIAPEWRQCRFNDKGERELGSNTLKLLEHHAPREVLRYSAQKGFHRRPELFVDVWRDVLRHKPLELCKPLQKRGWFYVEDVAHEDLESVVGMLEHASAVRGNLLLNAAPLGDGSIHPDDVRTLSQLARVRGL